MPKRTPKPNPPLESEIAAASLDAARILGIELKRQNTGAASHMNRDGSTRYVRFGKPGDPDYTGVLPDGRYLAVELKRPGQVPSVQQLAAINRINNSNGFAFWSDDATHVLRVLQAALRGGRIIEPVTTATTDNPSIQIP
jgi:hypothetical protein